MTTKSKTERLPSSKRFEFREPIGSGGVGTVYRAFDREQKELVAIKVLKQKLSDHPTAHLRLAREFRAAHELEHPNIVRAIAMENDGNISFVFYELVEGISLGDRIDEQGPFSEAEAVRIMTQVSQALHFAHQHQVVHRDVKPDNILLLPDGRVKLTDFGLAKDYSDSDDQELTRAASGLGTPHYMAPEQFSDAKNAGPLCDVYSLGATLYNMLTGKLPFDAKSPLAIYTRKETGGALSVRSLAPQVSESVEVAIRTAVDPVPVRRPASCLEFFKLLTSPVKTGHDLTATPRPLMPTQIRMDANRRMESRFPMKLGTVAVVDTGVHSESGSEEHWPLVVQDVSVGGLKILLARRFEPGSTLSIEMLDGQSRKPVRIPVQVLRARRDRGGHWIHGCSFVKPLSTADLKRLLKCT
ncbi:hypothetical protein BH11PLA2_BH11PLA2_07870 [soil metagenome]